MRTEDKTVRYADVLDDFAKIRDVIGMLKSLVPGYDAQIGQANDKQN